MILLLLQCLSDKMPVWPKTYKLKGFWRIPYQNINQPFTVYTDYLKNRQLEDVYNGQATTLTVSDGIYYVQKSVDEFNPKNICHFGGLGGKDSLVEYLPLNVDEYTLLENYSVVNGKKSKVFVKYFKEEYGYYNKYYLDYETNYPIRIETYGTSLRGSHPSIYIFDIYEYSVYVEDKVFIPPNNCFGANSSGPSVDKRKMSLTGFRKSGLTDGDSDFCPYKDSPKVNLPESFSWRDYPGVVPNTRDQANCGSCWAQGAAQALSSAFRIKLNKTVNISINQVMDCSWNETNRACLGGNHDSAFYLLRKKKIALTTEENYPYTGISGTCVHNYEDTVGYVTGCFQVRQNSVEALKTALYLNGPIAVAIYADENFYYYNSGVYRSSSKVGFDDLNHVVTLTGWKWVNGVLCWEIQNSWSDVWGVQGFGYISVAEDGDMGITLSAFVPEVALSI